MIIDVVENDWTLMIFIISAFCIFVWLYSGVDTAAGKTAGKREGKIKHGVNSYTCCASRRSRETRETVADTSVWQQPVNGELLRITYCDTTGMLIIDFFEDSDFHFIFIPPVKKVSTFQKQSGLRSACRILVPSREITVLITRGRHSIECITHTGHSIT